jgi:tripartite-type tricarboxylate transporter receptor subunit TctC
MKLSTAPWRRSRMWRRPLAFCMCLAAFAASALDYPAKPVTLIVPFSPGGSTDVQARLVAKHLTERLGQSVVVDNKPGAASAIGTKLAASAEADGHTLLFASISQVTEPIVNDKAGFDLLRDFAPVSIVTDMPFLLVVECGKGAKSAGELIEQARAKPGALNYSSWGYGSVGNLLAEMFKSVTKLDIAHIPYKGEAPAVVGLMSGEVSMMFVTPVNMPHITAKKICPLAVTGATRLAKLPEVPTFDELGIKGMNLQIWFGVMAPAKTPDEVVDKLQREVKAVAADPQFVGALDSLGVSAVGSSAADFGRRIRADQALIRDLSANAKLKE